MRSLLCLSSGTSCGCCLQVDFIRERLRGVLLQALGPPGDAATQEWVSRLVGPPGKVREGGLLEVCKRCLRVPGRSSCCHMHTSIILPTFITMTMCWLLFQDLKAIQANPGRLC